MGVSGNTTAMLMTQETCAGGRSIRPCPPAPEADLGGSSRGTLAIERDQACTKVEGRRVRTRQIRTNCHQISVFALKINSFLLFCNCVLLMPAC